MKKVNVNGIEVITNIGENHCIWDGNTIPKSYRGMMIFEPRETEQELLERAVAEGFTRVRFVEVTTRVKGYHETVALVGRSKR